jgi:hypothetical protein
MNDWKDYGWIVLILVVVIFGVTVDYQGNNYELTYKSIDVATGPNKTEHKTIVSISPITQGYKLLANFLYGLAVTLFVSIFVARKLEKEQKDKNEKQLENLRNH